MKKSPPFVSRAAGILLGVDKALRVRASFTLIVLATYLMFAVVQHVEVMLGVIDLHESNALTAFNLCGALVFYTLVRSGLSMRVAADPSLTLPQLVFATVSISWSYAISGPTRGAVLSIMIPVVTFFAFGLPARAARAQAVLSLVLLTGVMVWRANTLPLRYPPAQELVHFMFLAIVLGITSLLAMRFGRLRARLSAQKSDLAEALALNLELATRDVLTGLLNRRAMTELLHREFGRMERGHGPLAIAVLDIDWFKRINDSLGHGVGDEVLRRFAAVLKAQLRVADALARWGGEEFLLIMPGTRLDDARQVLERLRRAIAAGGLADIARGMNVTFSVGLAVVRDSEAPDNAIDRADRALYQAKRDGRDRIAIADA
jgi:diguanylate cyclase